MGNKCDMDESKRKVPYSKGQALADEFGIRFFETSAKTNNNVDEVGQNSSASCRFVALTRDRAAQCHHVSAELQAPASTSESCAGLSDHCKRGGCSSQRLAGTASCRHAGPSPRR